jgi:peptidoglycan/xylan/chitin deacetylase (PgdA/CDA1 family)
MEGYLKETLAFLLLVFKQIFFCKSGKVISVFFHNPPPELFEKIIRHLVRKSFNFISLDQLEELLTEKIVKDKVAIITIDDGWKDNMKLIEIIEKYKVFTAIFITTSAIEEGNFWFERVRSDINKTRSELGKEVVRIKKLKTEDYYNYIEFLKKEKPLKRSAFTREELLSLSHNPYITIGSHSISHMSFPDKDIQSQRFEMIRSKEILEGWLRKKVRYISYPSGDFTPEQIKLAEESGYTLSFTTETRELDLRTINKLAIPRRSVNDDAGFFEALAKIYGVWYKFKNSRLVRMIPSII